MKSSSGKHIGMLERRIRGLLDAASGAIGSNRTLALVFAVHIVVLLLVLFGAALFAPKTEIIEPVPVVMEPMPEQAAPAPEPQPQPQPEAPKPAPAPEPEKVKPEPKPVAPPPPEPDEIVEKKKPELKKVVRKKIVKPAPAPLPEIKTDENLKARLKSSLSKISSEPAPAPQQEPKAAPAAAQTSASSGQDTAVNVAGGQFPYNWYLGLVQAKISANWDKPSGMLMSDSTVSCVASFRIRRDGKVTDVAIARSSGNAILDDSALGAIRACDPMPPLPDRFSGAYIDIRMNFNLVK